MARQKTPSFVAEFPVGTTPADRRELDIRLFAGTQIYNASLGEALSRLDRMRCSLDYRRAQAMPRHAGKKPDGTPKPNPERVALFKATAQRFGVTSSAIQQVAERCRDACWIGDHVMSHDTQTTSLRAFRAVEAYAYGQRGRPRFKSKHRGLRSIEGKGDAVIILRSANGVPAIHYGGLILPLVLAKNDPYGWQAQALATPTKYVRLVRRIVKGRERWYAQLVQNGLPPVKLRKDGERQHPIGAGVVGADLGPSAIAVVGEQDAFLEPFCPTVPRLIAEQRRIQRAMDRSRRATNPEAFNADGTYKKGKKTAVRSRRYQQLRAKLADTERRLAAERHRAHGELANRVLALGTTVKIEALSYKAWQKCFGRSVRAKAPGLFVALLRRKAESAGGAVIEFSTRSTRLSQYDHRTRSYMKKALSQRWHTFDDGTRVQRDLYSAKKWLASWTPTPSTPASANSTGRPRNRGCSGRRRREPHLQARPVQAGRHGLAVRADRPPRPHTPPHEASVRPGNRARWRVRRRRLEPPASGRGVVQAGAMRPIRTFADGSGTTRASRPVRSRGRPSAACS